MTLDAASSHDTHLIIPHAYREVMHFAYRDWKIIKFQASSATLYCDLVRRIERSHNGVNSQQRGFKAQWKSKESELPLDIQQILFYSTIHNQLTIRNTDLEHFRNIITKITSNKMNWWINYSLLILVLDVEREQWSISWIWSQTHLIQLIHRLKLSR